MNVRDLRFPLVDSLRAIAALSVVGAHAAFPAGIYEDAFLRQFVTRLDVGVTIFFVISGFLLYRPFVKARVLDEPPVSPRAYGWRRFLRIVPAFWVALTVIAYVQLDHSEIFSRHGFFTYYCFGQVYRPETVGGIPQAWTLCVEVAFYALLPIWALAARRLPGRSPRELVRWQLRALATLGQSSTTTPDQRKTRAKAEISADFDLIGPLGKQESRPSPRDLPGKQGRNARRSAEGGTPDLHSDQPVLASRQPLLRTGSAAQTVVRGDSPFRKGLHQKQVCQVTRAPQTHVTFAQHTRLIEFEPLLLADEPVKDGDRITSNGQPCQHGSTAGKPLPDELAVECREPWRREDSLLPLRGPPHLVQAHQVDERTARLIGGDDLECCTDPLPVSQEPAGLLASVR